MGFKSVWMFNPKFLEGYSSLEDAVEPLLPFLPNEFAKNSLIKLIYVRDGFIDGLDLKDLELGRTMTNLLSRLKARKLIHKVPKKNQWTISMPVSKFKTIKFCYELLLLASKHFCF